MHNQASQTARLQRPPGSTADVVTDLAASKFTVDPAASSWDISSPFVPGAVLNRSLRVEDFQTKDAPMKEFFRQLQLLAETPSVSFVLHGETGTGKEVYARAVHNQSQRNAQGYVIVDCAALIGNLAESELFGHTKGSFTNADSLRRGMLLDAHNGSAFIDEVTEIPPELQLKFLRFMNEKRVRPIGTNEYLDVDVRIIAASNRDLDAAVAQKIFREDLRHRLGIIVHVPALRERPNDLAAMIVDGLQYYAKIHQRTPAKLTEAAEITLNDYRWPGNVRELCTVLEALTIFHSGQNLEPKHILPRIKFFEEEHARPAPAAAMPIPPLVVPSPRAAVTPANSDGADKTLDSWWQSCPMRSGNFDWQDNRMWMVKVAYTVFGENQSKTGEAMHLARGTIRDILNGKRTE